MQNNQSPLQSNGRYSRRAFLRLSGMAAGSIALAACGFLDL